ncbi:hypothetical protein [Cohnella lupini]|uniref:Uncharacterized protein n=1 Tax=Cohnella lupini TaxID=1294267 RepID=A0A3D9IFK9_9BACL|nr:hypothetical protein [Cohnella lupini]RED60437.1 hypothetical protein DFP95_106228 [Cohnella lupini]
MSISEAEYEYQKLLDEQKSQATGMRLVQLQQQGEGERKLLVDIIWPVRKSYKGITLEKEMITLSGVKAYVDAVDENFRFGLEAEGYVPHAETITRPRFDFEKVRVRSMVALDIKYIPFTYDEMAKKPDMCRRALYELYGRHAGNASSASYQQATIYEREVIRYALWLARSFRMDDVKTCLGKGTEFCREVLRSLIRRNLIKPHIEGLRRNHEYVLVEGASKLLW